MQTGYNYTMQLRNVLFKHYYYANTNQVVTDCDYHYHYNYPFMSSERAVHIHCVSKKRPTL